MESGLTVWDSFYDIESCLTPVSDASRRISSISAWRLRRDGYSIAPSFFLDLRGRIVLNYKKSINCSTEYVYYPIFLPSGQHLTMKYSWFHCGNNKKRKRLISARGIRIGNQQYNRSYGLCRPSTSRLTSWTLDQRGSSAGGDSTMDRQLSRLIFLFIHIIDRTQPYRTPLQHSRPQPRLRTRRAISNSHIGHAGHDPPLFLDRTCNTL